MPVLLAPVGVGAALAAAGGAAIPGAAFSWAWLLVALAGAGALFAGTMAINDYYDERSGADGIARLERSSIVTGSGFIASETLTARDVLTVAAVAWVAAAVLGLAAALARDAAVLAFGVAGALLAHQYWAPPARYGYRGLGLLGVFVAFGPLAVGGSYLIQTRTVTADAWWASLVPGLLSAIVFHHADMLHWRGDKTARKMTLAARLGVETSIVASGIGIIAAYVALTVQVAIGLFPAWTLLALVTAPAIASSWGRAARDPIPQNVLNLLGMSLGVAVLVGTTIAVTLVLA